MRSVLILTCAVLTSCSENVEDPFYLTCQTQQYFRNGERLADGMKNEYFFLVRPEMKEVVQGISGSWLECENECVATFDKENIYVSVHSDSSMGIIDATYSIDTAEPYLNTSVSASTTLGPGAQNSWSERGSCIKTASEPDL